MITSNLIGLLALLFLCMSIGHCYSIGKDELQIDDDSNTEPYSMKFPSFSHSWHARPINLEVPLSLNSRRQLGPAETYFAWPRKIARSTESGRGKRFWLFAKKDGVDIDAELVSGPAKQHNSLTQGLWRSGIVGRRR